jgi:hypothetical protein
MQDSLLGEVLAFSAEALHHHSRYYGKCIIVELPLNSIFPRALSDRSYVGRSEKPERSRLALSPFTRVVHLPNENWGARTDSSEIKTNAEKTIENALSRE